MLSVSRDVARRFMRLAVLLERTAQNVSAALAHHGYIQIDPINVCGRMHDLILRNRVVDYREGDLMRYLHGADGKPLSAEKRVAFEHHMPDTGVLVAFSLDAWAHLPVSMRQRGKTRSAWSGKLTPREVELSSRLLAEIEEKGPLNSDSFADDRKAQRVWGAATLAKATLQKLFFHGRLLIAKRDGARRFYDIPSRVLPAKILATPEATPADTARWLAHVRLKQKRLAMLKRVEFASVEDLVLPVKVEDSSTLYCLREDEKLWELAQKPDSEAAVRLLAPLDPLIYDRRVTRAVWDFDYTWEVYTPAHKRVRGYYALPVLSGNELVGHVDPKADRPARRLRIVSRSIRRGHVSAAATKELARFLNLRPA